MEEEARRARVLAAEELKVHCFSCRAVRITETMCLACHVHVRVRHNRDIVSTGRCFFNFILSFAVVALQHAVILTRKDDVIEVAQLQDT